MRHRCNPWNHIPYQREGLQGWKVLKDTVELQDWKLNAAFHFDRTLLLISMHTPTGVHEQSPENSEHPGDALLPRVPRLFLTLHSFASISVPNLKRKSSAAHLKTSMTCSQNSGSLCVVHHLWSFHLDSGFQAYANEWARKSHSFAKLQLISALDC